MYTCTTCSSQLSTAAIGTLTASRSISSRLELPCPPLPPSPPPPLASLHSPRTQTSHLTCAHAHTYIRNPLASARVAHHQGHPCQSWIGSHPGRLHTPGFGARSIEVGLTCKKCGRNVLCVIHVASYHPSLIKQGTPVALQPDGYERRRELSPPSRLKLWRAPTGLQHPSTNQGTGYQKVGLFPVLESDSGSEGNLGPGTRISSLSALRMITYDLVRS